ncbi:MULTISPECIES: hypothetical protein [unclassified Paenibacillus]|uniref:DUF7210 family protein n=1 Tax=unclassified Paenibacillus TaxID=185978 RepID=UPI0024067E2B|nr:MULTISPECIES: hypothetical protein [unclassified Paenibacillus]MDF9845582.1 hypothetical protein [Paenibacillus sp. PastF-2]MDF9858731.1 hypothetical protein [Paenibacillus sp. PastF-1]MDH6484001.1 hypothetical protein [Paenibacillus sp. PastH-2]MDH6511373.1 hypothetical protein [Paenibacillus sp. PastM-3]
MAYKALGNILHSGKNYKKGDEIPGLKKEEAKRLIDLKVLEEESAKEAKSDSAD